MNTAAITRTRYVTLQQDYIITPLFLATTRVAYNRTLLGSNVVLNVNNVAQPFVTTIGGVGGNIGTFNGIISGAADVNGLIPRGATVGRRGTKMGLNAR